MGFEREIREWFGLIFEKQIYILKVSLKKKEILFLFSLSTLQKMCFKDTHTPMCLIMLYYHWVFAVKYNQSLGILGLCIIMSWSHLYQGSNELKYTYFFSKSSRLPMTLKLVISFIYRDTAGIWLKKNAATGLAVHFS